MKCDKYKAIINKWQVDEANSNEFEGLEKHISGCSSCMAEYNSVKKMKKVNKLLQDNKPELAGKGILINNIFSDLTKKKNLKCEEPKILNTIFSQQFRLAVLSIAASLVVFFMVQQGKDIIKIEKLEAQNRITKEVDYNPMIVKAGLLLKFSDRTLINSYLHKTQEIYKININEANFNKNIFQNTSFLRFFSTNRMTNFEFDALLDSKFIHKKNRSHENDTL